MSQNLYSTYKKEFYLSKKTFDDLFSLEIRRTVHYVYDFVTTLQQTCKDEKVAYFRFLENKCPITFDDFRKIFNHSDVGQEILCYLWIKYHSNTNSFCIGDMPYIGALEQKSARRKIIKSLVPSLFYKFLKLITLLRKPNTIAIGTYWGISPLIKLILQNRFRFTHYNNIELKVKNRPINKNLRENIKNKAKISTDPIIQISFILIADWWPEEALETLTQKLNLANDFIENNRHRNTQYWCFENWISNFDSSVIKAQINKSSSKKSINFEHNYTASFFKGNSNDIILNSCDYNVTLGLTGVKNSLMAGSLFRFRYKHKNIGRSSITNKYLLVLGIAMPRTPEYSGAYGDAGRLNSALTLIDTDQLLREIPDNIKSKVLIKAYPKSMSANLDGYDYVKFTNLNLEKFRGYIDSNVPAKKLMNESELVIVNYVSTSHLESMYSNIPTLIYWPHTRWVIDENYLWRLDELEKVGILHYSGLYLLNSLQRLMERFLIGGTDQMSR